MIVGIRANPTRNNLRALRRRGTASQGNRFGLKSAEKGEATRASVVKRTYLLQTGSRF